MSVSGSTRADTSSQGRRARHFSNYIWSHAWNVQRSAEVKAKSPNSLTVHGGPNTPKYDDDIIAYLASNPHVDITVHGEGEATFADVLDALRRLARATGHPTCPRCATFPASSTATATRSSAPASANGWPTSTPSRRRTSTACSTPSVSRRSRSVTVETNRGCPYGCTFCDWGSATMSRMRKFDLQRVRMARRKSSVSAWSRVRRMGGRAATMSQR